MDYKTSIKQLFDTADGLLITAGAGMGVDSGLPDFRGNQGLWQYYPALGHQRLSFEQIANPYSFYNSPRLAWGFYGHRLQLYRHTTPHQGFQLLLDLAKNLAHGYFVFTSNVDGQFQKAGFNSQRIFECLRRDTAYAALARRERLARLVPPQPALGSPARGSQGATCVRGPAVGDARVRIQFARSRRADRNLCD